MIQASYDVQLWGSVADMLTAVAAVLGIIGLYLLGMQVRQATLQLQLAKNELKLATEALRTEHERYKEANAFAATASYVNWGPPTLHFARELAEELDEATCKKIEQGDECHVPFELKKKAAGCLLGLVDGKELDDVKREVTSSTGEKFYKLTEREAIHIRWLIVSHLSQLEIALLAWHHNSANEKIIEGQFTEFVCPSDPRRKPLLSTYRAATGGSSYYPALTHFIEHIAEKRAPVTPGPSPAQPQL